tara:strand:+ start:4229 stop:4540 length:312 start_codon:yes stop_codon:yes gene_type:complete
MAQLTIKTISAENTFTDAVLVRAGYFSLSISGLSDSTVTVQKSYQNVDNQAVTEWVDVDTFTADAEEVGFEPENRIYRVGIKTGDYGSDTVIIRLGKADRLKN